MPVTFDTARHLPPPTSWGFYCQNEKDTGGICITDCHLPIQGSICLDTLTSAWSPVQTIKTALLSVRMLLEVPNPKDPQDAEVATMLMLNGVQFAQVAQQWAIKYAGAEMTELDLSKWKESPPPDPKKSIADR